MPGKRVALYLRISADKNGEAEGVAAQERQGRAYAASAWPGEPVEAYIDNDISAYNGDHRPGYDRLRADLDAGLISRLWTPEQSRLERNEVRWFDLAARLTAAGISELHTSREGIIRVGDVVSGIKAVLGAHEVKQMKARVNARLADIAAKGEPPGSKPFGYVHGTNERGERTYLIVPAQAEAIRWAADRVLAGWSLSRIKSGLLVHGPHRVKVRDADGNIVMDGNGDPVTRPTALRAGSVRSMVTNPTVAGYRVHRGQVVGEGNWEAILARDVWEACRSKLSAPREVDRADGKTYPVTVSHTGFTGRKYTLTGGLARCGVCGAALVGSVKQLKGGRRPDRPYLLCHPTTGGKACVGIMLPEVEDYVVDRLFAELDKPEFLDSIVADDHVERRGEIVDALAAVEAQRAELATMWGTPGSLTTAEWQAARAALNATERQLRTELAEKAPPPQVADIGRVRATWPLLDLGEQREFLRLFIDRVVIKRAQPGRKGFDAGRVAITWL